MINLHRLASLILASAAWGADATAAPPNLLLVTIDTLRADRLGCYGYRQARTPVLDGLASEGVRFAKAFSPVPLTLPAHASLMTGLYPPSHGVRDNAGFALGPEGFTMAEALSDSGYSTAAVVGAFVLHSKFGLDQGFDRYSDDFDLSGLSSLSPGYIQREARVVVDEAIDILDSFPAERPFFLWVHLYDPHDPYQPPEPFASRHPNRPYDGEIEYVDTQFGRLLERLRGRGLYERTLIVVAGDHGEALGDHGELKHGFFIYNAALQVPLIFRFPDGAHSGTVPADPVSLVDIFPTVAQVLEIDRAARQDLQGRGLLSMMLGKAASVEPSLYAESYYPYFQFGWSPLRALIKGRQKYILAPFEELYDLEEDFTESRNLAPERKALANGLRAELEGWLGRLSPPSESDTPRRPMDAETLARLSSLGYVSVSLGRREGLSVDELPDPKKRIQTYNRIGELLELSSQGRYLQAAEGYRQLLESEPDLKLVRYKLGQSYFETGQLEKAADEFKRVIQQGGPEAPAVYDLALCYLRMGRLEDAAEGFKVTLDRDPSHFRARINLGVVYRNLQRLADSIVELEKAIQEAPEDTLALGNLGISYSLADRHEEAVRMLEKAIRLAPEDALLHANLATVYRRKGDLDKAAQALEVAKRLNPDLFRNR